MPVADATLYVPLYPEGAIPEMVTALPVLIMFEPTVIVAKPDAHVAFVTGWLAHEPLDVQLVFIEKKIVPPGVIAVLPIEWMVAPPDDSISRQ